MPVKPSYQSLIAALKDFFEIDFATMKAEWAKLTDKDKADFVEMFKVIGVIVEEKKAS